MIEAMLTGVPFEAPVNIPNTGQAPTSPTTWWWSRSASSTATGSAAGTSRYCPRPTPRSCAGTWPPRSSPSRRRCAGDRRWRRRPSRSTRWPAGAICGHGRHGRRAPRRHGGVAAAVRIMAPSVGRKTHAHRIHRARRHGTAHGRPSRGGRPRGHVASRSRGPIDATVALGATDGGRHAAWPRPPRSSCCACPTRPRWWRWSTPCCRPWGGQDGGRLLDHRPRRGAGPARPVAATGRALSRRAALGGTAGAKKARSR